MGAAEAHRHYNTFLQRHFISQYYPLFMLSKVFFKDKNTYFGKKIYKSIFMSTNEKINILIGVQLMYFMMYISISLNSIYTHEVYCSDFVFICIVTTF